MLVVRLIAQQELTTEQIAKVAEVSRKMVFNYRDKVLSGGVAGLLKREWAGARTPVVHGAVRATTINNSPRIASPEILAYGSGRQGRFLR
jgi:hypothetical protein